QVFDGFRTCKKTLMTDRPDLNELIELLTQVNYKERPKCKAIREHQFLNQCVDEMITVLAIFLMFPRVISIGSEAILVVYYGPASTLLPPGICFFVYAILLNGVTYYNIQMTACFAYR
ncbi:hypothetical protein PMAYCL1PPCAC_21440, partial [Pristionchus mayeri]